MRPGLVIGVCLVCLFAFASSAFAHIGVTPGLLVVGDTQTLILTVHNDLDRPMTGLTVSAPSGVRIGLGDVADEWEAIVENETATWTGGPLAANTGTTFEVELAVDPSTPVGPVQLDAEQLYPNGGSLPWPIPLTVIPENMVGESSLDPLYIPGLALDWLSRRSHHRWLGMVETAPLTSREIAVGGGTVAAL